MDSVTDKQSYLSMTGIDQTEENTESITVLNAQIADFVKNVIPFIILKSTDQPIVGIKTFLQPIGTCGFEPLVMFGKQQPITFNPNGKYKLVFDPANGFQIDCPLSVVNDAISIKNVRGLQDALDNPKYVPLPDRSVSATQIAYYCIRGDNLVGNIAINTTGNIKCNNADITTLVAGSCTTNKINVVDNLFVSNPLLNISIPFCPVTNSKAAQYNVAISFFSSPVPTLPLTNRMLRYRHPFNYYVHGISIMYAAETQAYASTTTIRIVTYNSTDVGTFLGTADIPTSAGKKSDYYTFPTPLLVTSSMTLGGDYSTPTGSKQGAYVIMGYQA